MKNENMKRFLLFVLLLSFSMVHYAESTISIPLHTKKGKLTLLFKPSSKLYAWEDDLVLGDLAWNQFYGTSIVCDKDGDRYLVISMMPGIDCNIKFDTFNNIIANNPQIGSLIVLPIESGNGCMVGNALAVRGYDKDSIIKLANSLVKSSNTKPSTSSTASNTTSTTTTNTTSQTTTQTTGNTQKKPGFLTVAFSRLAQKQRERLMIRNEDFMATNLMKSGVVSLPSGLQYKVIKQGNGKKPRENSTVKLKYEGRLIDGKVFDSSNKNNPITLNCNQVIKGFSEALTLMPVGSTWEVYIPYKLAYGSEGVDSSGIPPYSTLIYQIELLSIERY